MCVAVWLPMDFQDPVPPDVAAAQMGIVQARCATFIRELSSSSQYDPPQRAAKRIFEFIRDTSSAQLACTVLLGTKGFVLLAAQDRSALGEIFTVEALFQDCQWKPSGVACKASFLEIYSPDGVRETLIDLLASKADEEGCCLGCRGSRDWPNPLTAQGEAGSEAGPWLLRDTELDQTGGL